MQFSDDDFFGLWDEAEGSPAEDSPEDGRCSEYYRAAAQQLGAARSFLLSMLNNDPSYDPRMGPALCETVARVKREKLEAIRALDTAIRNLTAEIH